MASYIDYTPPPWLDILYLILIFWVHFYYLIKMTNLSLRYLYFKKVSDAQCTQTMITIKSFGFNSQLSLSTQRKLTLYHLTPMLNQYHKEKTQKQLSRSKSVSKTRDKAQREQMGQQTEQQQQQLSVTNTKNSPKNAQNANSDTSNNKENSGCNCIVCDGCSRWINSREILTLTWNKLVGIRILLQLVIFISICCCFCFCFAFLGSILFEFIITIFVEYDNVSYLAIIILIPMIFIISIILKIIWQCMILSWQMIPDIIAYKLNKEYHDSKLLDDMIKLELELNGSSSLSFSSLARKSISNIRANDEGSDDESETSSIIGIVNNNRSENRGLLNDKLNPKISNDNTKDTITATPDHSSGQNNNKKPSLYSKRSIVAGLSLRKTKNKNKFQINPSVIDNKTNGGGGNYKYNYNSTKNKNNNKNKNKNSSIDANLAVLKAQRSKSSNDSNGDERKSNLNDVLDSYDGNRGLNKRENTVTSTITALSYQDRKCSNPNFSRNPSLFSATSTGRGGNETDTDLTRLDAASDVLSQSDINVEYQTSSLKPSSYLHQSSSNNRSRNRNRNKSNDQKTKNSNKLKNKNKNKNKNKDKNRKKSESNNVVPITLVAGDLMTATTPSENINITNINLESSQDININLNHVNNDGGGTDKFKDEPVEGGLSRHSRQVSIDIVQNSRNFDAKRMKYKVLDDWLTKQAFFQLMDIVESIENQSSPYFMAFHWRLSFFMLSLLFGIFASIDEISKYAFQDLMFIQLVLRYLIIGGFCWIISYTICICIFSISSRLITWKIFHRKNKKGASGFNIWAKLTRARSTMHHGTDGKNKETTEITTAAKLKPNDNSHHHHHHHPKFQMKKHRSNTNMHDNSEENEEEDILRDCCDNCCDKISNFLHKSYFCCIKHDIWKLFFMVDLYGIRESNKKWRLCKILIILAILSAFIVIISYGYTSNTNNSQFVVFISYIILVYYLMNIILCCKPCGFYYLIKDSDNSIPNLSHQDIRRQSRLSLEIGAMFGTHARLQSLQHILSCGIDSNAATPRGNVPGFKIDINDDDEDDEDDDDGESDSSHEKQGLLPTPIVNREMNTLKIIEDAKESGDHESSSTDLSTSHSEDDDCDKPPHGIALKLVDDGNNNDNNNNNNKINEAPDATTTYNVPDPIMPSQSAYDHGRIVDQLSQPMSLSGLLSPTSNPRNVSASEPSDNPRQQQQNDNDNDENDNENEIEHEDEKENDMNDDEENDEENENGNDSDPQDDDGAIGGAFTAAVANVTSVASIGKILHKPTNSTGSISTAVLPTPQQLPVHYDQQSGKRYSIQVSEVNDNDNNDKNNNNNSSSGNSNSNIEMKIEEEEEKNIAKKQENTDEKPTFQKAALLRERLRAKRAKIDGGLVNDSVTAKYLQSLREQDDRERKKMTNIKLSIFFVLGL